MAHYNAYLIDKNGNSVFFKDKPDLTKGDLFISVSQILAMEGAGDFLITWALKEFGGQLDSIKAYRNYMDVVSDLGSKLHKYMEFDLKGEVFPEKELTEAMLPGIDSWLDFKQKHQIRLIDSERVLFSRKYRIAGTIDLRVEIDGVQYIADLKTGSVQDKAFTQLTAYKMMMKEMGLSDGSERLLVLGGSDTKNKIANGGAVQMHTLESWFSGRVTEEDLFVQLMCLRQMWQQKNLKTRKFEPVIKGMAEYIEPLVQSFRDSFEMKTTTTKKTGRKKK